MLIGIGLLILAVLLFGSARVLGALGAILGFIAASAGLAMLAFAVAQSLDLTPNQATKAVIFTILGVIVAGKIAMDLWGDKPGE